MPRISRVSLYKQIKVNGEWKLAKALFDNRSRVRKDHVMVAGKDELHTEGTYFIEYWHKGKRAREAAGPDAVTAAKMMKFRQGEIDAIAAGVATPKVEPPPAPERLAVEKGIADYLDYIKHNRTAKTFRTYRSILGVFGKFNSRAFIDEIAREDLLAFSTYAFREGQKGKSVYNKLIVVAQLLKHYGRGKILHTADWPKFVETVRPIYENEELQALFVAATPEEGIRFKFFLLTGFRAAEVTHTTWRDIDMKNQTVKVTAKPAWGFTPKNWEERVVTVPTALITALKAYKPTGAKPDDPVFPSVTGNTDGEMLDMLKAVAFRAGLNCGHDVTIHKLADGTIKSNRCAIGPYCKRWFLHKFRHTYATRHLQDGVDIRTLQQWMGHKDIKSTMVYLKGVKNADMQDRLNKGSLAGFV